jgi:assimilatory nitrate reductase catalytic subunit
MILSGTGTGTAVTGNTAFPVNKGALCVKGWTSAATLAHPERLLTPLVRNERGVLVPADWEVALDRVASAVRAVQARYGRDAVGIFGGGSLTNEKAYQLGKFARVALGTSNIDYNGRFCMSSAATAGQMAFGLDRGLPFPLADLAATEVIVLVGGNPAETMPPIMAYFDEQRRRGGSLIVVDPRATPVARGATLHLQTTPGSDLALANGLLHIAVEKGLLDDAFITERTTGFAEVRRLVASYWPDRVERITGVPVADLVQAAYLLGHARTAMILSARGAEQHSKGTETVLAFINLALALGHAGKPYAGYGTITGQGNGQGGREHGQKADQLPGYRRLDNPAHRAHIAAVWGLGDPAELPGPGRSAYEMLASLGSPDGVRALFVMGSNVVVSAPNATHIQQRLGALDFLTVSDFFLSETARQADVVLPAAQWAEEAGTTTNLEGRVLLRQPSALPPSGVRTDLHILAALAERLDQGHRFSADPRAVFDELRRASAGGPADYAGMTYERIAAEGGVCWPCPETGHPGTPRLFLDRFATPDGRARFHAVRHRPAGEEPDEEYPLYLTTGACWPTIRPACRHAASRHSPTASPIHSWRCTPRSRRSMASWMDSRCTSPRGAAERACTPV